MSMEINGNCSDYKINCAGKLKEEQAPDRLGKAKEAEQERTTVPHDEYVSGEKTEAKPIGLYRMGQDEDGNRTIIFDDPERSDHADEKEQPKVKPEDPERSGEKCTGNTDKVDREIRELKKKRQQLKQQIQSASGEEEKVRELEKKLAQVESELRQKDNDAYRRQHSAFSG